MHSNGVLLIEDNTDTREITALLLNQAGFDVFAAHDVTAAMAMATAHPDIAVLVADMYLANGETSDALIRRFRAQRPNLPVVVTSAHDEAALTAQALDATFLPKPYGRHALVMAVVQALARADRHACEAGSD